MKWFFVTCGLVSTWLEFYATKTGWHWAAGTICLGLGMP